MPYWLTVNWHELFVPTKSIMETVIRGSVTYLSLFVLLRLFRRQTGSMGPADLLVLLLIADASQNAMAGEYRSVTDGLVLVSTIVGWEYTLDYLGFHFPALGRFLEREPLPIIQDGVLNERYLKQELMTVDELMSQLREKGVSEIRLVKQSFIEGDGRISVILEEKMNAPQDSDQRAPGS